MPVFNSNAEVRGGEARHLNLRVEEDQTHGQIQLGFELLCNERGNLLFELGWDHRKLMI